MANTAEKTIKTNEQRRAEKLQRKILRAHNWRVKVWAEQELRIQALNAELAAMEMEPVTPYATDFTSAEKLRHYSQITIEP